MMRYVVILVIGALLLWSIKPSDQWHTAMAELCINNEVVRVSLSRRQTHVYLPEYERKLEVLTPNHEFARALPLDSGGLQRVDLFLLDSENMLIKDRIYVFHFNVPSGTITEKNSFKESGGMLGAFDQCKSKAGYCFTYQESNAVPCKA